MKLLNISVPTQDPGRAKPYITLMWSDSSRQTLEVAAGSITAILKAITELVNDKLDAVPANSSPLNSFINELEPELRVGGGATLDELFNLALAVRDELEARA